MTLPYFWLGKGAEEMAYLIDPAEWRMIVGSSIPPDREKEKLMSYYYDIRDD